MAFGGGLYADDEYLAALEAHHREAKENYRIYRLRRLVKAGYSLAEANRLELEGVPCHEAEKLLEGGCTPENALRILI